MNKIYLNPLFFTLLLFFPAYGTALAGFNGSISFTAEERAAHEPGVDKIVSTAASCLQQDIDRHFSFHRKHGVSAFYGDRSAFGKLSHSGKRQVLREMGLNPALLEQMQPTSCVGLVLKCLGQGFRAAGQEAYWQRIRAFTMQNGVDGLAMQLGLQQLGWKVLYWNPDVRMNREWDRAERAKDPENRNRFWGYHEVYWQNVHKGRYLYNSVDDYRLLVNFGKESPATLKPVPFFVGTGHGGYHVFPGFYGKVVEAHSTRKITDVKTLETAPFNPLNGQAPTGGMYHSGLIAIPAKYFR